MSDLAPGLASAPDPSEFRFSYPELPVSERRDEIMAALAKHRVLIVEGGTGSGKSTQLPKIMLEAGLLRHGLLGVTQPRRLAALALTDRLREETLARNLIGSQIRFHEDMPTGARVKVMTDGVLLQEYRRDPYLRRYDAVIIDEAHERSLNIDILLGVGLMLCKKRSDFHLVVASATLDAERFQGYFADTPGGAGLLRVEGRQYPVRIEYRDPGGEDPDNEDDFEDHAAARRVRPGTFQGQSKRDAQSLSPLEAAAAAIRDLMMSRPDDLLCFLPTEKEINELARELEKDLADRCVILPLYGRLSPGDQKRVYQRHHRPKVVLATNIAETSLTLPGIAYVVDTGTARISRYHPQTRIQGLPIEKIAQASAAQRAGRAGRVKPGLCIRLYSEEDLLSRPEWPEPEILRGNLTNAVLQLLSLRLPVLEFPFLDPPAPVALKGAYRRLQELGAVTDQDENMQLTDLGWRMSRLPVDAALAKILLTAQTYRTLPSAMVVAAGLTVQDPRITPLEEPERGKAVGLHRRFDDARSDFLALLKLWAFLQREWRDGFSQRRLRRLCEDNFLSYLRVREWMDLVEQFARLLAPRPGERDGLAASETGSPYDFDPAKLDADALHKAILSGFLAHLARRRRDEPGYRLVGDKEAFIHSGSGLAKRRPEWIVAGEVRQTSRTFIQRACEIEPAWVEEVAPDAVKRSYGDIAWNAERGFVEAIERVSYRNFTLRQDRRIDYARVDAAACAAIFWQEGVIRNANAGSFAFIAHNEKVLRTLVEHEAKARRRDLAPGEETLLAWYLEQAPEVHSRITLQKFLDGFRNKQAIKSETPLHLQAETFEPAEAQEEWRQWQSWTHPAGANKDRHTLDILFPDRIETPSGEARVNYRFDYGQELDGLAIEAPLQALPDLNPAALWSALPGWRIWIFQSVLEKCAAKDAERLREKAPDLFSAWHQRMQAWRATAPEADAGLDARTGILTPASALSEAMAETLADMPQALPAWPVQWPPHLRLKLFFTAANGRRLLLAIDPGMCRAEWALTAAEQIYGKGYAARHYGEVFETAKQAWSEYPPPLQANGLLFAPGHDVNARTENQPRLTCIWRRDNLEAKWDQALASAQVEASGHSLDLWDRQGRVSTFLARRFDTLATALRLSHPVLSASKPLLDELCQRFLPQALSRQGMPETLLPELEKKWRPLKIQLKPIASHSAKSLKDLQMALPDASRVSSQDSASNSNHHATWWLVLGAALLSPEALWLAVAEAEKPFMPSSSPSPSKSHLGWQKACEHMRLALGATQPAEIVENRAALAAAAHGVLGHLYPEEPLFSQTGVIQVPSHSWEGWQNAFSFSASSNASPFSNATHLAADVGRKKNKLAAEALRQELKTTGLLPQSWPKGATEKLDAFASGSKDGTIVLQLQALAAREALKRKTNKAFPVAASASEQGKNAQMGSLQNLQKRFKKL